MQERPKLIVPPTSANKFLEGLGVIGLITLWVFTIYIYPNLPETIPIHFNSKGEVDGYGSRMMAWLAPVIAMVLFGVLTFLNQHPHQFNYSVKITSENALRQYTLATRMIRILKWSLIVTFILLQWELWQASQGNNPHLSSLFLPIILMLMLLPVIYFVWQSQRQK